MKKLNGLVASEGLALANAYILPEKNELLILAYPINNEDLAIHEKRLDEALSISKKKLSDAINTINPEEASFDILKAQLSMLEDESFIKEVKEELREHKMNIEFTLKKKVDDVANILNAQDDVYMQARAIDIQDAFDPVLHELLNVEHGRKKRFEFVPPGVILFAKEIKPSEAIFLKQLSIAGLVTEEGSATSHIAIMARSWGIPMLVGVANCTKLLGPTQKKVILDCNNASVLFDATEDEIEKYAKIIAEQKAFDEACISVESNADNSIIQTKDGININLSANITLPEEASDKRLSYASAVGLFRTEFLILDRNRIPSEDEQFKVYSELVKTLGNKPIVMRTFDIGADKMIGEQEALAEKNPMLGWRGIRFCLSKRNIFKTQVKAMFRASVFGNLRILLPMLSAIEEIIAVKKIIEEAKSELRQSSYTFSENIPLGIMVEVPSVAIMAKTFAKHVDFMSIGTNDLTQYVMATDRENVKVANLASYFNPAVLQLIDNVIKSEQYITSTILDTNRVSMCGEMASDELAVCLLFAMGLRSFSMQMRKLSRMRTFFSKLSLEEAQGILAKTKKLDSAKEISDCVFKELKTLGIV